MFVLLLFLLTETIDHDHLLELILFSEWISCTIITGGRNLNPNSKIEVLIGDLKSKKLPDLPQNIEMPSMVLHYGTILVFGGWKNNKKCLQLDDGTWKDHSTLNEDIGTQQ